MGETATAVRRSGGALPMWRRLRRLGSNPLLVKELRARVRGGRAFVVLTTYLLLLSCFTSLIYYAYVAGTSTGPGSARETAYLGRVVFSGVVLMELFMVTFITPAFTAGAISGERERRTYELLRTTLLPAHKLVFGKLASALTYVLLLILAAVPLESLAFVLGGVVMEELTLALVILLVTALVFGVLGIFYSSLAPTTLVSTVLTYGTALIVTIGLPVLALFFGTVVLAPLSYSYGASTAPSWVVEAGFLYTLIFLSGLSPISAAAVTDAVLVEEDAILYFWVDVGAIFGSRVSHRIPVPSPWLIYAVVHLGASLAMLLLTVLRVRRQARF